MSRPFQISTIASAIGSGTRGAAKSALGILHVDDELRKAGNSAPVRRMGRLSPGGRRTKGVAGAKSAAGGGTTNQIFTPAAARSRGPLLLFICKAGLNYGAGKEARWIPQVGLLYRWLAGSIIVPLAPP